MLRPAGRNRAFRLLAVAAAAAAAVSACASSTPSSGSKSKSATDAVLRLGYFPNVTHAPALVGVQRGFFAKALGPNVRLETDIFDAGPAEVTALFSGALDAAFLGPSPAISAWQKSDGAAIRVVAGATSGGAEFVVQPGITSASQLRGKRLADPQLGNTQDIALRYWLLQHGLHTNTLGGGQVSILPLAKNSLVVPEFESHAIAGAWMPEPYASDLVVKAHGHVLVNERSLWPGGQFATTLLVVRTGYLQQHPGVIKDLIKGEAQAIQFLKSDPTTAEQVTNAAIKALTSKSLKSKVLKDSFANLTFTLNPIESSILTDARHAEQLGLLSNVHLSGLFDLTLLNQVLVASGQSAVSSS